MLNGPATDRTKYTFYDFRLRVATSYVLRHRRPSKATPMLSTALFSQTSGLDIRGPASWQANPRVSRDTLCSRPELLPKASIRLENSDPRSDRDRKSRKGFAKSDVLATRSRRLWAGSTYLHTSSSRTFGLTNTTVSDSRRGYLSAAYAVHPSWITKKCYWAWPKFAMGRFGSGKDIDLSRVDIAAKNSDLSLGNDCYTSHFGKFVDCLIYFHIVRSTYYQIKITLKERKRRCSSRGREIT
jgi:hypothetical protein